MRNDIERSLLVSEDTAGTAVDLVAIAFGRIDRIFVGSERRLLRNWPQVPPPR